MPPATDIRYAGHPAPHVYKRPADVAGKTTGKEVVQQLLWGDWLAVKSIGAHGWLEVNARGEDGWIHESNVQSNALLQITFVDIGQGDGCILTTPDDRHVLVDAGQEDNMYRFLRWRFGRFAKPFRFEAAVLTHSDMDHYRGLRALIDEKNARFGAIYHNGLVERVADKDDDILGSRVSSAGRTYVTDVVEDEAELRGLLADASRRGSKLYPNLLWDALEQGRVGTLRSLSVADGHLPGFGPGNPSGVEIQVLGPVLDTVAGRPAARWFGDVGKTKNGHSVVLRAVFGRTTIFLGGDLNIPAEHHLLAHHTQMDPQPGDADEEERLLRAARRVLECEIVKSCHHGSADFDDLFLRALNPLATVVSSGDAEPHAHPRSDTLGAIGRNSRGRRPLIFSTELARSAPERLKQPAAFRRAIDDARKAVEAATPGTQKRKSAEARLADLLGQIERSVAIYGAINLRTDGDRVVMAQKLESPSAKKKWDLYAMDRDAGGSLRYQSKYET